MTILYLEIALGVLGAACIGLFVVHMQLKSRLKTLFLGKKGEDIEDALVHIVERIKKMEALEKTLLAQSKDLDTRLRSSLRGVELKRYNPFSDGGGNQSFALALLDENGKGIILSSLFARERTNVFGKPITKGISEFELSDEEREVLDTALKSTH